VTRVGRLPILTFHAIDERSDVCAFPPRVFRRGVGRLRARGTRALGLAEIADLVGRRRDLPDGSVAVTFDDGYRSVYDEAFPILHEAGMTATVFLTVGSPTATGERLPSLEGR